MENTTPPCALEAADPNLRPTSPPLQEKALPWEVEAKGINETHQVLVKKLGDFAAEVVPLVVQLGEKLKKIKKGLGHGPWEAWCKKYLDFDVRTARRYMAKARLFEAQQAKRTHVSDLKVCGALMDAEGAAGVPEGPKRDKPNMKLFSNAAVKVLNQGVDATSSYDKITILDGYERLEPIALQLCDEPSIFNLTWRKKMQEPPARWARHEVALFKAEVAKAQEIERQLKADAEFDASPANTPPDIDLSSAIEGDAP